MAFTPYNASLPTTQPVQSAQPQAKTGGFTPYNASMPVTNSMNKTNQVTPTPSSPDLLGKVGNVVNSIFPGKQVGQAIGTLGAYGLAKAKDLLTGSKTAENVDLSAPSPLQTTGDVVKGVAMVGGLKVPVPSSVIGNIALGAGAGAVSGAGEAATKTSGSAVPTSQDISQVGKGGLAGGIAGGIVGGATSILGHVIQSAGDKIQMTSIKPTMADIKDGFSIDTIKQNDLGGSLSTVYQKTQDKMDALTAQLNEKLTGSNSTVNLNDAYKNTVDSLTKNTTKSFGSNASIENALTWLKNEIGAVSDTGNVTIPEAQQIKQATGKYGAWQYGVTDPEATARQTVANAFYNQLKTSIENNSPAGVKEINQQLSKLIPISNAVVRRIPVAERNSALSLTDMMTATASIFNPHALVGLGISLAQKEGTIGNLLSKLGPVISKFAVPAASASGAIVPSVLPAPPATQP